MTGHLSDEQLARGHVDGHLGDCADCQARAAGWQNMAGAAHAVSAGLTGEFSTPSFGALLGPALGLDRPAPPVEVVSAGPRASWRLVAALSRGQLRLLPRALVPLTLLGFAGCVLLAVLTDRSAVSPPLFGLAVTLVIQLGTLTACSPRTDPRLELFATLPITPMTIFADRLVLVLAADTVLALLASVAASGLGVPAGVAEMIASWLGQAMFASAVGVVCAVWRSTTAGALAGGVVWLLGAMSTLSGGGLAHRIGSVIAPLWSTSSLPLLVALVLLATAVSGMRRSRYGMAAG